MRYQRMLAVVEAAVRDRPDQPRADPTASLASCAACLEELLLAFIDIADLDDIHQASARLERVQAWIREEARGAAADPLLAK